MQTLGRIIKENQVGPQATNKFKSLHKTLAQAVAKLNRIPPRPAGAPAEEQDSIIGQELEILTVPSIGPGDADVFTKEGRHTFVTVNTQGLSITAGGASIQFQLLYRIEEAAPDYTTLEARKWILIPAPQGWKITAILPGSSDVNYYHDFMGKDHQWHDVSQEVGGTYATWLLLRFDGDGRDDEGNAQLKATIQVPVHLEQT